MVKLSGNTSCSDFAFYCLSTQHGGLMMTAAKKTQITCYLIGETSLVIQCADILLAHGFKICGIISSLSTIKEWTLKNQVSWFPSLALAEPIILTSTFDYFFSIMNKQVLSSDLVQKPTHLTINYHDSLLPRYAGVNATNWSLLNNEKTHGITWHAINHVIDGGNILKQAVFDIGSQESAHSLNFKCFHYAIKTFKELAYELANNTFSSTAQNLNLRTYYGMNKKPVGNGWIDWNNTAEEIDRFYRALNSGNYINMFSLPKFMIGNEAFIIDKMQVLDISSNKRPGTLVKMGDIWQITTKTNDLLILQVSTLHGDIHPLVALENCYSLTNGDCLSSPSEESSRCFEKLSENYFKYENFWVQALLELKPASLPFLPSYLPRENQQSFCFLTDIKLTEPVPTINNRAYTFLLTSWLLYLYRSGNHNHLGVYLAYPHLNQLSDEMLPFFANYLPFTISVDATMEFNQLLNVVDEGLNVLENKHTYLRDVMKRYPSLKMTDYPAAITAVIIGDDIAINFKNDDLNIPFACVISTTGTKISWFIKSNIIMNEPYLFEIAKNIAEEFRDLSQSLIKSYPDCYELLV